MENKDNTLTEMQEQMQQQMQQLREKLDKQKAACRKRFGSAVHAGSEEAEILDRLLGIQPGDLKKDNM